MNNDEKILEILLQVQSDINNLKNNQYNIDELNKKYDNTITYMDTQFDKVFDSIESIKNNLNDVESITAKNWLEITHMKKVK